MLYNRLSIKTKKIKFIILNVWLNNKKINVVSLIYLQFKGGGVMDLVIQAVTKNYFNFSGRAQRKEFWLFMFVYTVAIILSVVIDNLFFKSDIETSNLPLTIIFSLVTFIPYFSVTVRRLHDIGKSGWFLLLGIIPLIGPLILLYFYIKDSQRGENKFGPSPKYTEDTPAVFA